MSFPEHTGPKTESEIHENKVEGDKLSCSSSSLKVGNTSESGIAEEDQKVITPTKNSAGITARKSLPAELEPDKDNLGRLYNDQLGSNPGMPNKTAPSRRIPHLHKLEKKHSSGDLHSRLKTRKLLGVGETDDGDVHRSKLSQILGHSDQLYIRLPNGLRIWQIVLSTLLSVMAVWALMFPKHFFMFMYEVDGSSFTFPIRLYASALVCISVMYWSTIQASDRDLIRLVLLSSIVFFALQALVLMTCWLPWHSATPTTTYLCSVLTFAARLLVVCVSSYFYWITCKDGKSKDVKYYR